MNLRRRQLLKYQKKIQIIIMLALKQKVKRHIMKQGDYILEGDRH